ncbi:hypothetical protein QWY20_09640 [Alkalimonas sp. MEB108]|uniref:Uncharacterized protein n=1 Tax=Alkalimonas cellulosilytica TaxID=3058395 RepID=A0ABU7J5L8_9GAMM|nr:hypothetical protein [Alkalimonas sp. MEB108]MEE2001714.1 hypothetical protein [Alkalimonas sp. MEB108]
MNNNVQVFIKPGDWQPLYQAVADFYQTSHHPTQADAVQQQADQLAQAFCNCASESDYAVYAQLPFHPEHCAFCTVLALKQCSLLYLLGRALQWPEKLIQQLLCTALLSLAALAAPLNKLTDEQRKSNKLLQFPAHYSLSRLKTVLAPASRYWLQHCYAGKTKPSWQQNPFSTALQLTNQLARQLVLNPADDLLHWLRLMLWRQPDPASFQLLEALAGIGSALWRCGLLLQQEQQWLVLDQQAELWLGVSIRQGQLSGPVQAIEQPDKACQLQGGFHDWRWLQQISKAEHSDLIQQSLPAIVSGHESASVLDYAAIQQLCALEPAQLLCQLEQDATGTALLLAAASKANRSQQEIHQLKHALLLLGHAQLPWLLAQVQCQRFALQQHQPYHHWLVQLRALLHQALSEQPWDLPAAQLELLSWLLCLPLWQQSALRYLAGFSPTSCQQLHKLCQQQLWQSDGYLKRVLWLLKQYQQPKALQQAVLHFRVPASAHAQPGQVSQYSELLHGAWQCCDQFMLQPAPPSQLTEQLPASLLQHCYYPLTLTM